MNVQPGRLGTCAVALPSGGGEGPQRDRGGELRGAAAARAAGDPAQQCELARALRGLRAARGCATEAQDDEVRALRPHLDALAAGARAPARGGGTDAGGRRLGGAGKLGAGVGRRTTAGRDARVGQSQPAAGDAVDAALGLELEAGGGLDREAAGPRSLTVRAEAAGASSGDGDEGGHQGGEQASGEHAATYPRLRRRRNRANGELQPLGERRRLDRPVAGLHRGADRILGRGGGLLVARVHHREAGGVLARARPRR